VVVVVAAAVVVVEPTTVVVVVATVEVDDVTPLVVFVAHAATKRRIATRTIGP